MSSCYSYREAKEKIIRIWILIQGHGSGDPDSSQNVTDPEHCRKDLVQTWIGGVSRMRIRNAFCENSHIGACNSERKRRV
jgi:hypothetical protein